MPQSICNNCLEKLVICYMYRELSLETQIKMQKLYDDSQNHKLSNDKDVSADFTGNVKSIIAEALSDDNIGVSCSSEYLNYSNQQKPESLCKPPHLDKPSTNNPDVTPFTCEKCSKVFSSKYSLNRHVKVHQDSTELQCHICFKKFTR